MNGTELLLVLGMALAVYAPKVLPLAVLSERSAGRLQAWLRYVAPAVLGALVAPSILARDGHVSMPSWELVAYLLAGLVAATTRRLVAPLGVGLGALLVLALLRLH
jgi:branched-subunit amino acid transport protein